MAHIKEPIGVDLIVKPMVLTLEDRQAISAIITAYKSTGEIPVALKTKKHNAKTSDKSASKRSMSKRLSPVLS